MSSRPDMSSSRGRGRPRLLLLALLTTVFAVLPVRALTEEASSIPFLPAELAAPSTLLPIDLVVAVEDAAWDAAAFHLERALDDAPGELGLRALRQALEAGRDPDAFLREPSPPPDSADLADRYEAAHGQMLRLELERGFYRGDRDSAATFIARQEERARVLDEALARLDLEHPHSPWILLTRAWLHRLQHTLTRQEVDTLWQVIGEAGGHWRRYLRLLAVERELSPAQDWLELELPVAVAARDPLAARVHLLLLERQTRDLPAEQAIARYVQADAAFPEGAWRDDFELAWAKRLARAYTLEERKKALTRLEPLTHPPLRNTTVAAAGEYAHLLRRMRLFPKAVAFYEQFHRRFPSDRYRFDREIGLALYTSGRYEEAVGAFRRSAESPRGNGRDYLYIAEAMRFLPGASPLTGTSSGVREEALKLTDFASAAMVEEIRVRGWSQGLPTQAILLRARLSELEVLSRHALLYPLTFLTIGLQSLIELLAVGLGLIVFVSWPRLSRRVWRPVLGMAAAGVALPVAALGTSLPVGLGGAGNVAWVGQAGVRLFFLLAGTIVLSSVVRMRGLELLRTFRRAFRCGRIRAWIDALWPVVLCALALVVVGWLSSLGGRAPTAYLARLPTVLAVGELGAAGGVERPGELALELYHVLRTELLARGFLLALLVFLLRGRPRAAGIAVVAAAVLWTMLTAGAMEPAPVQLAAGLGEGLLLGWLRLRRGIDGAVAAHGLAVLVAG